MPQKIIHLLQDEVGVFKEILEGYPKVEWKESFILARVKVYDCIVTLYDSGKLLIQGSECEKIYDELASNLPSGQMGIGIDEAGRGENFGPLVVAGVLGDRNKLRQVRDSKKTKDMDSAYQIVKENVLDSHVVTVSSSEIDNLRTAGKNMNMIQAEAVREIIMKLRAGADYEVFVDGSPVKGIDANFIEGGDDLDPIISAASVLAKYTRDKSSDKGKRETWKSKAKS